MHHSSKVTMRRSLPPHSLDASCYAPCCTYHAVPCRAMPCSALSTSSALLQPPLHATWAPGRYSSDLIPLSWHWKRGSAEATWGVGRWSRGRTSLGLAPSFHLLAGISRTSRFVLRTGTTRLSSPSRRIFLFLYFPFFFFFFGFILLLP